MFAVGELGLRLDEFYDMSWYEYSLKSKAYRRMEDDRWKQVRVLAYHSYIAPSLQLKQVPRFDKFLNANAKPKRVSDETRSQFLKEYEEYLRIVNKGK